MWEISGTYDNSLPWLLPSWVIRSTTNVGDLVADPFLGGGSTAEACLRTRRRFYGGDVNPDSPRFVMGRFLDEVIPALDPRAGPETAPDDAGEAQLELDLAALVTELEPA